MSGSPAGTPGTPMVPLLPVKRGRGRPPKAETLARRQLEQQQAALRQAELAASGQQQQQLSSAQQSASTPSTRARTNKPAIPPKPVIPEPVSDSDEPVELPSAAAAAAATTAPIPPLPASMSQPLQQFMMNSMELAAQRAAASPFSTSATTSTGAAGTRNANVERYTLPSPPPPVDLTLTAEEATDTAFLLESMNEPALSAAIDLLSSPGGCSINDLHVSLALLLSVIRKKN